MDRPDRRRAHRQGHPDQPDRPPGQEPAAPAADIRAGRRRGPLVICDAGYSAAALTAALAGQPAHLLVRLPAKSVFYGDPVTWPGRNGRPPRHGIPVTCHNEPAAANPEPDESLLLPDTPHYGTVRVDAWHDVHPIVHGDRGWFKDNWHGELPILRGTLLRVLVDHLPGGRPPHKTMWLWHAGPPRCRWTSYGAPTWPALTKSTHSVSSRAPSGSPPPRSAPPTGRRWVRLVMAAYAQLLIARPHTADLRRAWERPPGPARPMTPGRVRRGFPNIRRQIGTPAHVAKPRRPGPGRPKGTTRGRHPATRSPRKAAPRTNKTAQPRRPQVKPKLRACPELMLGVAGVTGYALRGGGS